MIDTDGWSAMKKLKHSLLRRAFNENRGGEVILLIQWRVAAVRHAARKDVETLKEFECRNAGQPRAIRALNLIEEQNGNNVIHKLTEEKATLDKPTVIRDAKPTIKSFFEILAAIPEDDCILFADKEREAKIKAYENVPALNADHYDPMEGLRVTTGYDLACRAYAATEPRVDLPPPVHRPQ